MTSPPRDVVEGLIDPKIVEDAAEAAVDSITSKRDQVVTVIELDEDGVPREIGEPALDTIAETPKAVAELGRTVNDLVVKVQDVRLDLVKAAELIQQVAKGNHDLHERLIMLEDSHDVIDLRKTITEGAGKVAEVRAAVEQEKERRHQLRERVRQLEANIEAMGRNVTTLAHGTALDERLGRLEAIEVAAEDEEEALDGALDRLRERVSKVEDSQELDHVRELVLLGNARIEKLQEALGGPP